MTRLNTPVWMMASFIAGTIFVYSCGGGGSSANGAPTDAEFAALQTQVTALETLLAAVTDDGTTLTITGRNVQIVSGSGTTDDNGTLTGLGNLIIGYNDDMVLGDIDIRTGSHNLIVGDEHSYSSFGGFVAGFNNTISGPSASVSSGHTNTARGVLSSVSGGLNNTASNVASTSPRASFSIRVSTLPRKRATRRPG